MLFKIDENLPPEAADLLREHGHDAKTALEEKLGGVSDTRMAEILREENRALITLDLDFADVRSYPPRKYPGIIVLRLRRQDKKSVLAALNRILPFLDKEQLKGFIWIVEEDKLRVRSE